MKQKLFLLIIFLSALLAQLAAKNLTQELQHLSVKLKDLASIIEKAEKKDVVPSLSLKIPDFNLWKNNCDKLPKYDIKKKDIPPDKTALTFELFTQTLEAYFTLMKQRLGNSKEWLNETMPDTSSWNNDVIIPKDIFESALLESHPIPFIPFVEKTTFKPTDVVAFHGDFHGDIHACNNFIQTWINAGYIDNNFKIIKNNFYSIFLGDYTDRGWYGIEVIYALLRLKIANPTRVFMVRGNHEDLNVVARYGFIDELERKFAHQAILLSSKITRFYNFLPMTVYFSCPSDNGKNDTIQCCHGGIEIGYNPSKFLSSNAPFAYIPMFMQKNGYSFIQKIAPGFESDMQNNIQATTDNGFMWSDFIIDLTGTLEKSNRGVGMFVYGKEVTEKLLQAWSTPTYTLRAIFRAHQHVPDDLDPMKQVILNFDKTLDPWDRPQLTASWYEAPKEDAGIAFLWSDSAKEIGSLQNILALTFSVAPGTPYDWPYDAFGLLKLAQGYDKWRMFAYRIKRSRYEKE